VGVGRVGFPLCRKPQTLARTAALYGVTPAHFILVVKARKKFRAAQRDRARKVGTWGNNTYRGKLRAGEGELHGWLRRLNMTGEEFSNLVGMNYATFKTWFGFCMWEWPVRFLALYAYARNMEKFLQSKGYDVEQFRDSPITEMFHQHYRIRDPSKLILEGITPEQRKQALSETRRRAAQARWGKKDPDYTPWKI